MKPKPPLWKDMPDIRNSLGVSANFAKSTYNAVRCIESESANNYNVYQTAGFTPED